MDSWEIRVVLNMESDEPELLGTYIGTEEDAVGYKSTAGVSHWVPVDCVKVVRIASGFGASYGHEVTNHGA